MKKRSYSLLLAIALLSGIVPQTASSYPVPATVSQTDGVSADFKISRPGLTFDARHYEYRPVSVVAGSEDVDIILPADSWIQTADVPASGSVAANSSARIFIAPDGPTANRRSATITFRGRQSGKTVDMVIDQAPVDITDALPAKWYYNGSEIYDSGWMTDGHAPANLGKGQSEAVMTAVGVNNRRLGHVAATTYKQSLGVSNLYTGDYLLFSVPVKSLPAGTDIDFMLTIAGNDNTAPKYWIAEILDGGQWRKPEASALRHADGVEYSFYTKYFPSYQHATFAQNFRLENPVDNGLVQVRCRVVGDRNGGDGVLSPQNSGTVFLPSHEFHACSITAYPGITEKDAKKLAVLGNSFTYFNGEPFMLKEIARSQGHRLDLRSSIKGSQYFNTHVVLERSKDVIWEPGYDFVILQDQSEQHNKLADGKSGTIVEDTKTITGQFRQGSPDAEIILENTWASPKNDWNTYKSPEKHTQQLITGAMMVAQADTNINCVSPVGIAFKKAYDDGITGLWHTDLKHPGRNGSYLKACVHYLMMFGEPFDSNVPDCECDPATAARLRQIAEQTVLGHEGEYCIR